jgi:hypothetical protein
MKQFIKITTSNGTVYAINTDYIKCYYRDEIWVRIVVDGSIVNLKDTSTTFDINLYNEEDAIKYCIKLDVVLSTTTVNLGSTKSKMLTSV